jgi:hypothetical protein
MRLYEVADSFVDDLETVLRNLVGRGDSKHAPQNLTYPALGHLMKNMGYGEINFDIFTKVYDDNPQLQPLIRDFNDQGIVLGTKVEGELPAGMGPGFDAPSGGKSVDQMAHHAIKNPPSL